MRRRVVVDSELFLQLEAQLPDEPTDTLPSQAQFIARDLALAFTRFESGWEDLPAITADGTARLLVTRGVLVYVLSIVGVQLPDGTVSLVRINVDPYPPAGLIDPDEHDEK